MNNFSRNILTISTTKVGNFSLSKVFIYRYTLFPSPYYNDYLFI